jgi:hypothetical protein
MTCYNLLVANFTNAARKFLRDVKEIFDKPLKVNNRMSRYVIYKENDDIYYGNRDD